MLLLFVILAQVYQHVLGEEVVNVSVDEGMNSVLLPCSIPGGFGDISYVVWLREDLDPATIEEYEGGDPHVNPWYSSRTSILIDLFGFFSRDLSLALLKPHLFDSGTYTCIVHSTVHGLIKRNVELQVISKNKRTNTSSSVVCTQDRNEELPDPSSDRDWTCMLVIVAAVVCVAVVVAGLLWKNTILISHVTVSDGECLVELPHRTFVKLPESFTVEWSRCTPEPTKVHVCHITNSHLIDQDQIYQGRTSLKKGSIKLGGLILTNLSLILKDPCCMDSGTYICTVRKEQDILVQKAVRLEVKVAQVEVEAGDWSKTFMLPFITTGQLPEDATVEWMRSVPVNMTVHVFENGKDQPYKQDECYHGKTRMNSDPLRCKDLSVTVDSSGYSDRGTYICTVRKEGQILTQRKFLLWIRGLTSVDVEVHWVAKTVKLPWFITANLPEHTSVEWSRAQDSYPKKKVHVFEDGQDQPNQQDWSYKGRTAMRKNPLQSGDLSLTLKKPTTQDHGAYVCVVRVNGEPVWDKVVHLKPSSPNSW